MKFSLLALSLLASASLLVQGAPIEKRNSGEATFYNVGLGYCGKKNSDSEMVAAPSESVMSKSKCGKSVTIKSAKGSVTVTVVDSCPGCSSGDVDLSPAAFKKLGSLSQGRIPITWSL